MLYEINPCSLTNPPTLPVSCRSDPGSGAYHGDRLTQDSYWKGVHRSDYLVRVIVVRNGEQLGVHEHKACAHAPSLCDEDVEFVALSETQAARLVRDPDVYAPAVSAGTFLEDRLGMLRLELEQIDDGEPRVTERRAEIQAVIGKLERELALRAQAEKASQLEELRTDEPAAKQRRRAQLEQEIEEAKRKLDRDTEQAERSGR